MKTLADLDSAALRGKRALVRVDFNVPLDDSGAITDDSRIQAALPTLRHLLESGARVVLMSHLGRPKGKDVEERRQPSLSLAPAAQRLGELLGAGVALAPDCVGEEVEAASQALQPGQALLLENLRFHPEEEKNAPEFAQRLARNGDLYVNDAFGAAHRAHASTEGVTKFLSPAVAGFLLQKEVETLGALLQAPPETFVAILGGSKVTDKIGVITSLLPRAKHLLIGGAMANAFLKAEGHEIGKGRLTPEDLDAAHHTLEETKKHTGSLELPRDVVVGDDLKAPTQVRTVSVQSIPADLAPFDIGPETVSAYLEILNGAQTIFWNGPVGVFETDAYAAGSRALADALAERAAAGANVIIGGGDSAAAVARFGLEDAMTFISTGGGASLEFLEGQVLPGVAALE